MKWLRLAAILLLTLSVLTSGCSLLPRIGLGPPQPTPPFAEADPTLMPTTEVTITVLPPENNPQNAELGIMILDEVTGLPYNSRTIPMEPLDDGRWTLSITPPAGTILRYRYLRLSPSSSEEITADGSPVRYRVAYLPGPTEVSDVISAWADNPYQGPTGRIVGRLVEADTGLPLTEIAVYVAGESTFSDGLGEFCFDRILPGLHNLTITSIDSRYQTAQQGAIVAAGSTTPAEMSLFAAPKVQVTFEVTLPNDTPQDLPVRLAGNLRQLGNIFRDLGNGISTTGTRMPELTRVDATHHILITQLYSGSDVQYKYTLGDGLWNAERDHNGYFRIRQLIVPDHDIVISDSVTSWHGGINDRVTFHVTTPQDTPMNETIGIQFNPFLWFNSLPMVRIGDYEWAFTLLSPLDFSDSIGYRYCRNLACGSADDIKTAGPQSAGRQFNPNSANQDLQDSIDAWQWWEPETASPHIVAPSITPRPDFEAGVELLPFYSPDWLGQIPTSIDDIANLGANSLILDPTWMLQRSNPTPVIAFDPAHAPFSDELKALILNSSQHQLRVSLHPSLIAQNGTVDQWWQSASRDAGWWKAWFDGYRSFILTYAHIAADTNATKLIIGGPEIAPALPGGVLADGSPSQVPPEADSKWASLISEIRSIYGGHLAIELEFGAALQTPPSFTNAFDEVHLYWHAPLDKEANLTVSAMQHAAHCLLEDEILSSPPLAGKPIVLSVEYLSIDGSASACIPAEDGGCMPPTAFDLGADVNGSPNLDLAQQSDAINAVLLEAYARPEITGFYVRRYNPLLPLRDKSASINGKSAKEVLRYWYPLLTGR